MTIGQIRKDHKKYIHFDSLTHHNQTPLLDCDVLLCHILNKNRSFLMAHDEIQLNENQFNLFLEYCKIRSTGYPIAYITNNKEFYGYDFYVNQDVLIPKPDTEILVEQGIDSIIKNNYQSIADICTGSGCVAISVYNELKKNDYNINKFYATDISKKALDVANININKYITSKKLTPNINLFNCDLCSSLIENNFKVDIILTNPPYVPTHIVDKLLKDGRKEPRLALDGNINNIDGLYLIKKLIPQCYQILNTGGTLLLETGEYNAHQTKQLLIEVGFEQTEIYMDYSNMPRVVKGLKI